MTNNGRYLAVSRLDVATAEKNRAHRKYDFCDCWPTTAVGILRSRTTTIAATPTLRGSVKILYCPANKYDKTYVLNHGQEILCQNIHRQKK